MSKSFGIPPNSNPHGNPYGNPYGNPHGNPTNLPPFGQPGDTGAFQKYIEAMATGTGARTGTEIGSAPLNPYLPVCLHPSASITVIREYHANDSKEKPGETYGVVKCMDCDLVFKAKKSVEKVKKPLNRQRAVDDIVEVKYIEKIYWDRINPASCCHSIAVSKKAIVDHDPTFSTAALTPPKPNWLPHYSTSKCRICDTDLNVRQWYEMIWRKGEVVKEPKTEWLFY